MTVSTPDDVTRAIDELTNAARIGIDNYRSTTRGAALLGAGASVARGTAVVRVFVGQGQFFEVTVKYYDLT